MKLFRLFITYIKQNETTGEEYVGHASGLTSINNRKAADRIMRKRDSSHHKTEDGFGSGQIDEVSTNKDAIIGREQMIIDYLKEKGICGNNRNAISPRRKDKMKRCLKAAIKLFGSISVVLLILYICNII